MSNEKVQETEDAVDALKDAHRVWLNAFTCVNPTEKFCAEVGRDLINMLMAGPKPPPEPPFGISPFRRAVFVVSAS